MIPWLAAQPRIFLLPNGCLLSVWLVHLVLKWLLGPEWKIFDLVPIRHLIDAGEATILLKLVWHLVREFA